MTAVQTEVAQMYQGAVERGHFAPESRSISVTTVALTNGGAWRACCVQDASCTSEGGDPYTCTCMEGFNFIDADFTCQCDATNEDSCGVPPQP